MYNEANTGRDSEARVEGDDSRYPGGGAGALVKESEQAPLDSSSSPGHGLSPLSPPSSMSLRKTSFVAEGQPHLASSPKKGSVFLTIDADIAGAAKLGKPIADLFLHTTVFFAEVVGFSAWSSLREPSEVFMLLEKLFQCFDSVAKQLQVFKVETIGETYMAVTGLPRPQPDHAVRMARFARECMYRVRDLTQSLEVELGKRVRERGNCVCV
jgi:hypothetical protein